MISLKEKRDLAAAVIKAINTYSLEFDAMKTKPNVIFMPLQAYDAVKSHFPYMIKSLTLNYNKESFRIVITRDTAIGLAFALHTDNILEYNNIRE